MESISLEAFKNDRIAPVLSGLADSKDTGKACDVMIGILNPFSFQLKEKFGYETFLINYVGATIGAHSGPGTLALFFWGDHR